MVSSGKGFFSLIVHNFNPRHWIVIELHLFEILRMRGWGRTAVTAS